MCTVGSVDASDIGCACINENDFPLRVGSRARRFLLTGHKNGTVQARAPDHFVLVLFEGVGGAIA